MTVSSKTQIAVAIVALLASAQPLGSKRQARTSSSSRPVARSPARPRLARRPATQSGAVTIDAMIAAVPGITDLANIKGEQISNVGSQDMSFDIMRKLAKRINELAASPNVDGIVITHGTDTMEETAFFLNLTVKTDKPIVLVGSMRPSTAVSADGPLNLYNAVAVAADPKGGRTRRARRDERLDSRRPFVDENQHDRAADLHVSGARPGWHRELREERLLHVAVMEAHDADRVRHHRGHDQLPRVDIIFAAADMSPDLIDCAVTNGAKGIVIAGVGNGNMNKSSVDAAARAVKKGVVVVRSSRVPTGMVGRNVELDDDKLGFIASDELNPQKARILLALALLNPHGARRICRPLFSTY